MITEENLRKIISESFCAGYVVHMNPPFDNDYMRMAHEEAAGHLSKEFEDCMVNWFDDRPKVERPPSEIETETAPVLGTS